MVTTASSAASGQPLVGGDQRVGQGVEQGLDGDPLVAGDLAEGVEELEVGLAHGVTTCFLSSASCGCVHWPGAARRRFRPRRVAPGSLPTPLEDRAGPVDVGVGQPDARPRARRRPSRTKPSSSADASRPVQPPVAGHLRPGLDRHRLPDGLGEVGRRPQRALDPGARHLEGVARPGSGPARRGRPRRPGWPRSRASRSTPPSGRRSPGARRTHLDVDQFEAGSGHTGWSAA